MIFYSRYFIYSLANSTIIIIYIYDFNHLYTTDKNNMTLTLKSCVGKQQAIMLRAFLCSLLIVVRVHLHRYSRRVWNYFKNWCAYMEWNTIPLNLADVSNPVLLLSYYSRFLTVYCNHIFPKNNYSASFYPNIRYLSNCHFTSFIQHLFILWKWIGLCVIFDLKTFYKYFLRIKPQSSIEKQAIWTCDFDWILN